MFLSFSIRPFFGTCALSFGRNCIVVCVEYSWQTHKKTKIFERRRIYISMTCRVVKRAFGFSRYVCKYNNILRIGNAALIHRVASFLTHSLTHSCSRYQFIRSITMWDHHIAVSDGIILLEWLNVKMEYAEVRQTDKQTERTNGWHDLYVAVYVRQFNSCMKFMQKENRKNCQRKMTAIKKMPFSIVPRWFMHIAQCNVAFLHVVVIYHIMFYFSIEITNDFIAE